MHLVTLIPLVLLAVLAWMRPLEGGIAFFLCGVVAAIGYIAAVAPSGPLPPGTLMNSMLIITAYPQILSGVLFFLAMAGLGVYAVMLAGWSSNSKREESDG